MTRLHSGGHTKPDRFFKELNEPPKDENWTWMSRSMLNSPSWRAMSRAARLVIDRVIHEHLAHAGLENGRLPVTYLNFSRFGVPKNSIANAIVELEALGLIRVVRGAGGNAVHRHVSLYELTWLPTKDRGVPSVKWTQFATVAQAKAAVRTVQAAVAESPVRRHRSQSTKSGLRNRKTAPRLGAEPAPKKGSASQPPDGG